MQPLFRLGVFCSYFGELTQNDHATLLVAYVNRDAVLVEGTACSHLHPVERSVSTALEGLLG